MVKISVNTATAIIISLVFAGIKKAATEHAINSIQDINNGRFEKISMTTSLPDNLH